MAFQVLQGLSPADQVRQGAGTDFAKTLGTGLQSLANQKMQELQRGRTAMGLQAFQGFTPERAQLAAQLPEDLLKEYVKQNSVASAQRQQKQLEDQRTKLEPRWNYLEEREEILDRIGGILDDPGLVLDSRVSGLSGLPIEIGRPLMEKISPEAAELDSLSHRLITLDDEARGKGMRGKFINQQRQKSKVGVANSLKNNKKLWRDYKRNTDKEKKLFTQQHPYFFNQNSNQQPASQSPVEPQSQQQQYSPEDLQALTTFKGDRVKNSDNSIWIWDKAKGMYVPEEGEM